MGVGSGIGGQFGFAPESTYGTPVTPTRFLPVMKAELKAKPTFAQGVGIQSGQFLDAGSQRLKTVNDANGSADLELQSAGFGLLWQALMGSPVTPVQQGATSAYLQTHTLADSFGKVLTLQTGIPDTTGAVRPYTLTGGKVTDMSMSVDIKSAAPVSTTWTFDGANVVESLALAAPSYPTNLRPFVGTDASIKVGAFGSEAAVDGVTKVDLKITRPLKVDRYYLNKLGTKAEPIMNGRVAITGTITADFVDKTLWADRFAANGSFSLVLALQGALIAGTYYQGVTVTLPMCFIDGDTPVLDSEDVVNGAFPFRCLWDGSHQPTVTVMSTDITL